MSERDNGGRAFPWCGDLNEMPTINLGMTLRDYFAAKAMQGMLANEHTPRDFTGACDAGADAYAIADAMLQAREA